MYYQVTTALTVYTTYFVEAESEEAASQRIADEDIRSHYAGASYSDGDNDDEEVIAVRPFVAV